MYDFSIGVMLESFRQPTEVALKKAREVGAKGIQMYAVSGEHAPEELTGAKRRELLDMVKSEGLIFSALCGDLGKGFHNPVLNPELIEKSKRILDLAKDLETDIVAGLECGADDYVTKPFSLAVLRARVNAQLRRTGGPRPAGPVEQGPFVFDFENMEFRREGQPVELSKTEQKLLRLLVENRGRTLTRARLVDRVWTDGAEYVDENALSVTVRRLRGKLEEDPAHPRYLKTVYGIGYTWTAAP